MSNIKENNLDEFKKELNSVKSKAKDLKINEQEKSFNSEESNSLNDKIVLTDIIDKKEKFYTNIENSELMENLLELQLYLDNQNKILNILINKLKNAK